MIELANQLRIGVKKNGGEEIASFKISIYLEKKIFISKLKSRMSLIQVKASDVGPGPNVEVNLYCLLMFYIFM